jgi:NAD kinase
MKVVIAHKVSELDRCKQKGRDLNKYVDRMGITMGDLLHEHAEHNSTIGIVEGLLNWKKVDFVKAYRGDINKDKAAYKRQLEDTDLVIVVGGDGTLFEAAHHVRGIPVWGINSHSTGGNCSVGWYCSATRFDVADKIEKVLDGCAGSVNLNRFQLKLDDKTLDELVLNDLMVSGPKPPSLAPFKITAEGMTERQRGSGIWIATAAGSTGAAYQNGGPKIPLESDRATLASMGTIRRDYYLKNTSVALPISVESEMWRGKVYIDGDFVEYDFSRGSILEISNSEPLQVVTFGPLRKKL